MGRVAAEPVKSSWWAWLAPSPRVAFAASALLVAMVWIGARQGNEVTVPGNGAQPEAAVQMESDLPVLENYDVLSNFEAKLIDIQSVVQDFVYRVLKALF